MNANADCALGRHSDRADAPTIGKESPLRRGDRSTAHHNRFFDRAGDANPQTSFGVQGNSPSILTLQAFQDIWRKRRKNNGQLNAIRRQSWQEWPSKLRGWISILRGLYRRSDPNRRIRGPDFCGKGRHNHGKEERGGKDGSALPEPKFYQG